jgi:hypothetical protein
MKGMPTGGMVAGGAAGGTTTATGITADGGTDEGRAADFVPPVAEVLVTLATLTGFTRLLGSAAFTGLAFAERGETERD